MRLLLVENDRRISALVCDGLRDRGFAIDPATTLATADAALDGARYDAIILDLGLPDGEGLDWLRRHQRATGFPPVLVVTARSALGDRIAGLDAGADDYLVKPFALEEVAARLRALLRRPGTRGAAVFTARDITFDAAARRATVADTVLDMTRREADLLELLIRGAGTVIGKRTIETTLYGYDEPVTPNAVEVLASRLRRKLERAGAHAALRTIRGVGYLLEADAA